MSHTTPTPTVAIVGAGPGGLVAARWLRASGFAPTVFEQHDDVGGQWNVGAPGSGVWPGMHTNTSLVMTMFGDLPDALLAGVPIEYRAYTRARVLAAEAFPPTATAAALRAFIVGTSGVAPPTRVDMVADMAGEMAGDVASRDGGARPTSRVPLRTPLRLHTWARALARALLFGPQSPSSFRLEGLDALPDAASRVAAEAFGAIADAACTAFVTAVTAPARP